MDKDVYRGIVLKGGERLMSLDLPAKCLDCCHAYECGLMHRDSASRANCDGYLDEYQDGTEDDPDED